MKKLIRYPILLESALHTTSLKQYIHFWMAMAESDGC